MGGARSVRTRVAGRGERLAKNVLHLGPRVLRDAPRLRRAVPQHEGILLLAFRKISHPEVPLEARPRRTQDRPPGPTVFLPASEGSPCAP